jgi:hypothetical protein
MSLTNLQTSTSTNRLYTSIGLYTLLELRACSNQKGGFYLTQNEYKYAALNEERRHNQTMEDENYRHNQAMEQQQMNELFESIRHSSATEAENERSHKASEAYNRSQLTELYRSNTAKEAENYRSNRARERETKRSNRAGELITSSRDQQTAQHYQRSDTTASDVASNNFALGIFNTRISAIQAATQRARAAMDAKRVGLEARDVRTREKLADSTVAVGESNIKRNEAETSKAKAQTVKTYVDTGKTALDEMYELTGAKGLRETVNSVRKTVATGGMSSGTKKGKSVVDGLLENVKIKQKAGKKNGKK